jgi:ferredoxin
MKYIVDENCIGCGLCASVCPEVFEMTDEGLAKAIDQDVPAEQEAAALQAKEGCPTEAIKEAEGE